MIGTAPAGMGVGMGLRVMVGVAIDRMVAEGDGLAVALGAMVTVWVGTGVEVSTGRTAVDVGLAQAVSRLIDRNTNIRVFKMMIIFIIVKHYISIRLNIATMGILRLRY